MRGLAKARKRLLGVASRSIDKKEVSRGEGISTALSHARVGDRDSHDPAILSTRRVERHLSSTEGRCDDNP